MKGDQVRGSSTGASLHAANADHIIYTRYFVFQIRLIPSRTPQKGQTGAHRALSEATRT